MAMFFYSYGAPRSLTRQEERTHLEELARQDPAGRKFRIALNASRVERRRIGGRRWHVETNPNETVATYATPQEALRALARHGGTKRNSYWHTVYTREDETEA